MILVDTSVWIDVLRDKSGSIRRIFRQKIGTGFYVLTRFNQLELLQGARDENEWRQLAAYLDKQVYLEVSDSTWKKAARIDYDLRRAGMTVTSAVDCCIAQIALEQGALVLHRDRDFETIAGIRPLAQEELPWNTPTFVLRGSAFQNAGGGATGSVKLDVGSSNHGIGPAHHSECGSLVDVCDRMGSLGC